MSQKVIKDSVHGYISLEPLFAFIIDTPEFQRLKSIEQGSFRVLYPAARHDRFIHSLGTLHLAKKFAANFISNIREDLEITIPENELNRIETTFYYASLLHDIGHAPFSHTTENLFKRKTSQYGIEINKRLFDAIQKTDPEQYEMFETDFGGCSPSAHEIISAIILIEHSNLFLNLEHDCVDLILAARMVLGCTYDYNTLAPTDIEEQKLFGIKNCFIRLLNSDTIDVDKMDYITRDTQMSGFYNVPIDIDRLVKSVTAISKDGGWLYPAFRKNALSVIDNVFRAKIEQGLWMVSHPIVLYDSELLAHCIISLNSLIDKNYISDVFSLEALSRNGILRNCKKKFSLLSKCKKSYRLLNDIDISSDIRAFYDESDLIKELFERQSRRHPVWKSYFEYKYIFNTNDTQSLDERVFVFFKSLVDYLKNSELFVIDEKIYARVVSDSNATDDVKNAATFLKSFSEKQHIPFDFVLLSTSNSFSPKFNPEFVYISFGNLPKRNNCNYETYKFLKGSNEENTKRLFYLYSRTRFSIDIIESFKTELASLTKEPKLRV